MRESGSRRPGARPSKFFAILVAGAILAGPLASGAVGSARADLFGPPNFVGFVTNDGYFFVEVGTSSFGSFNPVTDGSNVFGTAFTVVLFDLTAVNRTVPIQFIQGSSSGGLPTYDNFSVAVLAHQVTYVQVTFSITPTSVPANLTIDGTTQHYTLETPLLLIPLTNLTNGGFDLILLGILSEFLIFAFPFIILGRWMTRRALRARHLPCHSRQP